MAPVANSGIQGLQESGTGLMVGYQGASLYGLGMANYTTATYMQGTAGALASTSVFAVASSGSYLVSYYLEVTSASATGTIAPLVVYTSDNFSTPPLNGLHLLGGSGFGSQTSATTRGNVASALQMVRCAAGTNLAFQVAVTGQGGINPAYNAECVVMRIT